MSEELTPERLKMLGEIDRRDEQRTRENPPKPIYVRKDDKLSHVWLTPSRRTPIEWLPVIVVLVLALALYSVLVYFGILPLPF